MANPETPRPICDFFVDRDEAECIVEIYEVDCRCVTDFGVYPLNEDGSKGDPIEIDDDDPIWQEAHDYYNDWVESAFEV